MRILIGMLVLAVGLATSTAALMAQADRDHQVLRHIVLYKFKDDLKPGEVQQVIDAFAGLPKKIPYIMDFEHGTNVSPEGKSEGLTHAFVVTFADEKGRDLYLKDPAHLAYVDVVKNRREKVVVFDYWADE